MCIFYVPHDRKYITVMNCPQIFSALQMTEYWLQIFFTFQCHKVSCWTNSRPGPNLSRWSCVGFTILNNEVTPFWYQVQHIVLNSQQIHTSKVLVLGGKNSMFGLTVALTERPATDITVFFFLFNHCDCLSIFYPKSCSCTYCTMFHYYM